MTIVQAAVMACALGGAADGETVLLDFTATWCGPCRQMEPVVRRLAAQGIAVRQIDIDAQPALAERFGVSSVPCFVMLTNGRESGRLVGTATYEQLVDLYRRGATDVAKIATTTRGPGGVDQAIRDTLIQSLTACTVRIKIYDDGGQSVGTGTIVDARDGEALVLTCGHIFRDSEGKGRVTVDLFGPEGLRDVPARMVGYDLDSDLGFISFRPGTLVNAARIAPAGYQAKTNDMVVSLGCNHGEDATARVSRVTTIDKFLGTPNLQVAGQPVQGRSGGGLFSAEGYVIGVCNAADPEDDEGLFAALPAIHAELNQLGLAKYCLPTEPIVASAPPAMPSKMPAFGSADPAATTIPTTVTIGGSPAHRSEPMPVPASFASTSMPAATAAAPLNVTPASFPTLPTGPTAATSASAPADPAHLGADTEVVCIVRPRNAPGETRTIVIDRASPELMARLIEASRLQSEPDLQATQYVGPGR